MARNGKHSVEDEAILSEVEVVASEEWRECREAVANVDKKVGALDKRLTAVERRLAIGAVAGPAVVAVVEWLLR